MFYTGFFIVGFLIGLAVKTESKSSRYTGEFTPMHFPLEVSGVKYVAIRNNAQG